MNVVEGKKNAPNAAVKVKSKMRLLPPCLNRNSMFSIEEEKLSFSLGRRFAFHMSQAAAFSKEYIISLDSLGGRVSKKPIRISRDGKGPTKRAGIEAL